jgi:glycosyltransferase involved in cell wall biosynthesis
VIPTKDRPNLLQRALRSALAQRFEAYEIVVVDDGSGAGAALAAALNSPRISSFLSGGAGQVPARNLAVSQARGQWIACLDDDDWWPSPGHLEGLAARLREGPCLAYGSGELVIEAADQTAIETLPFKADASVLATDNRLLVAAIAYPRALHERLGAYDETLPYYWDWDWYLRLRAAGIAFKQVPDGGACVSVRGDSVSSQAHAALRQADLARLVAKHGLEGISLKNHLGIARSETAA